MSSGAWRLSGLDPNVRAAADWALSWADYYGVPVTVTSGYRSEQEQARLRDLWVRAGRPSSCSYIPSLGQTVCPANAPGDSAHNYGWAFDSSVPAEYASWWDYVRSLAGFELLPNDQVHAQVPNWRQYL